MLIEFITTQENEENSAESAFIGSAGFYRSEK